MSDFSSQTNFICKLISSFPTENQGVLGNLNSRSCNNNTFKWILEQNSEFCWVIFVNHLTKDFPIVVHNNLHFKPKLLLFPLHLQRNIVSMILENVCLITIEALQELDETMDEWKGHLDEWMETMHKLLKVKIKELENEKSVNESVVYVDVITEKSKTQFNKLCEKFRSCNNVEVASQISWSLIDSTRKECTLADEHVNSDDSLELIPNLNDEEDEFAAMDVDVQIVNPCVQEVLSTTFTTQGDKNNSNQLPEPPADLDMDEIIDEDNFALHTKLKPLQEFIQELSSTEKLAQDNNALQSRLQVFNELSSTEMEQACVFLQLSSLSSENTVAVLCQAFVKVEPEPSYQNTNIFALKCVLPCLQKLESSVSRLLGNGVKMFCEKYPTTSCNSLFIQLLVNPSFNSFQADIICKIIKDKFNSDCINRLFGLILDTPNSAEGGEFYWSEDIVTVLQTIIDSKANLDKELLDTKYVDTLKVNATVLSKSLKFTKLVLATIRKYGSLVSVHKQSFISILDRNETFLKKAGMASLKKIN